MYCQICKKPRLFVSNVFSVFLLLFVLHPMALADHYDVQAIGSFGGTTNPVDINESGQVVGHSQDGSGIYRVFIYENGAMTDIGSSITTSSSYASAINDLGHIIGSAYLPPNNSNRFYLFDGSSVTNLNELPGFPVTTSFGNALTGLNNLGQITAVRGSSSKEALFLTPNGSGNYDHVVIGYPGKNNWAFRLNEVGQIAGMSRYDDPAFNAAFLYDNGALSDIGTLGGTSSSAADINEIGQIAGQSSTGTQNHAYLYTDGTMLDLGTVGGTSSAALGLDDLGRVVGYSYTVDYKKHAFIYTDGSMLDLNDLIPSGSDWVLEEARGINNSGQIFGVGKFNGQASAFFLEPANHAPVANAGNDFSDLERKTVTIDGSASSDADGSIVSFSWIQTSGKEVTLNGADTATAIFRVPNVKVATPYAFQLTIVDDDGASATDTIVVTILPK